jgi:predicted nucleic acid-binding protein
MPCSSQNNAVISDTSCLISLTNIKKLDVLKQLYAKIFVTPEVAMEYKEQLPDWIKIKEVQDKQKIVKLISDNLDLGESSAIVLAMEMENSIVILDDKNAREYAVKNGLTITGTLGILSAAYDLGYIQSYEKACEDLRSVNFRFSKQLQNAVRSGKSKDSGFSL